MIENVILDQNYAVCQHGHRIRVVNFDGGDGGGGYGGGACYPSAVGLLPPAQHRNACTNARAIRRSSRLQLDRLSSQGRDMRVSPPAYTQAIKITSQRGGAIGEVVQ
jgi:hypothetical protein